MILDVGNQIPDARYWTFSIQYPRSNIRIRAVVRLGFIFLKLGLEFVALAAGGFQIEHQVFHIEPKLTQCILYQGKDSSPPFGALHNALQCGQNIAGNVVGQGPDDGGQSQDVGG